VSLPSRQSSPLRIVPRRDPDASPTRPVVVTVAGRDADWLAEFPAEEVAAESQSQEGDAFDLFPEEAPSATSGAMSAIDGHQPAAVPPRRAGFVRATLARLGLID
jgi:hypothetical protein